MTEKELWEEFTVKNRIDSCGYEVWSFGVEADYLAKLVADGVKTATSSAFALYEIENEPLPQVGSYNVILDSKNEAICIVQVIKVSVVPFNEVTAEHADREGERDKTLDSWRKEHEKFFTDCLEKVNLVFSPDMKVVCEEFELVYKK